MSFNFVFHFFIFQFALFLNSKHNKIFTFLVLQRPLPTIPYFFVPALKRPTWLWIERVDHLNHEYVGFVGGNKGVFDWELKTFPTIVKVVGHFLEHCELLKTLLIEIKSFICISGVCCAFIYLLLSIKKPWSKLVRCKSSKNRYKLWFFLFWKFVIMVFPNFMGHV